MTGPPEVEVSGQRFDFRNLEPGALKNSCSLALPIIARASPRPTLTR